MPNDKLTLDYNDPEAIPGVICKMASVSPLEVTDADLKKINKYTLSPVSADDVFIFKASIADNEQDDRNYMPFNLKSLQDLKKLYPGKTMLKDHRRMADNQNQHLQLRNFCFLAYTHEHPRNYQQGQYA